MTQKYDLGAAPSWGQRLIGIEGLRGLAAVMVIITHTNQRMAPEAGPEWLGTVANLGGQGLTLFFALSGFLLYRPFASAMVSGTRFPQLGRYFFNRALRIFPGYVAIFLIVALVAGVAYLRPAEMGEVSVAGDQPVGFMTDPLLLISNALMLQTLVPTAIKTGIPVAWSLTVELVFYVVMPMLALLGFRLIGWARKSAALWVSLPIAAMLVIGLAGKFWYSLITNPASRAEEYYLEWGGNWTAVLARSFLYHADLFAYGMIAALVFCLYESGKITTETLQRYRWVALAAGVVCVPIAWKLGYSNSGFAVLSGAVILFVATPNVRNHPGQFAEALDTIPFKFAGAISYSAYLWHMPVILLLQKFDLALPDTISGWIGNTLIVLAVTTLFSAVTYNFIEKPSMALKKRTDSAKRRAIPASG
jgi:peptidoglycan/LPS O-acetylase OafA/YrhL